MKDAQIGRYLAAGSVFLAGLAVALPDGAPGAPRAIAQAAAFGLMGAAMILGYREGKR